jgi:hypothetical protein
MLFNNTRKRKLTKLHYGTAKLARQTIKYLRTKPRSEQLRGAQTMYFRAKYHANQTKDMREAMKVYAKFMKSLPPVPPALYSGRRPVPPTLYSGRRPVPPTLYSGRRPVPPALKPQ